MAGKTPVGRWLFPVLLTFVIMAGCSGEPPKRSQANEQSPPKVGEWGDAPDFTLPDLEGGDFTLSSLKGKVIVVNFWGTWCPPCRREIPDFISFYDEYQDKGVEIVGVALERDEGLAVRSFVKEIGIDYTVVLGDQGVTRRYGGIRAVPTTFIIDGSGNIHQKHVGAIDKKTLVNAVRPLLQGKD